MFAGGIFLTDFRRRLSALSGMEKNQFDLLYWIQKDPHTHAVCAQRKKVWSVSRPPIINVYAYVRI